MKIYKIILFISIIIVLFFAYIYKNFTSYTDFNGIEYNERNDFITYLYFSLTTITSVGYGDISPRTTKARLLVMIQQLAILFLVVTLPLVSLYNELTEIKMLQKGQINLKANNKIPELSF